MDVRIASDHDKERWNQFVDKEGGSFFQYYDWKFVYEFYKTNRFIPLLIQDTNSDIIGIFPLLEQKGARIYPWLSSLPEGATGGFLLSGSLSDEEKNRNLNLFIEFIEKNYSRTHSLITLKEQIPLDNAPIHPTPALLENGYQWFDNSPTKLPCTHFLKLEQPFEEKIWRGRWSSKLRQQIRHAKKNGLEIIVDNELIYLDNYFEMYSVILKKFGGADDKEKIFRVFNIFQDKLKLFIGLLDSEPVSAALCFYTPTTAYLSKAPYLPASHKFDTNTPIIGSSIEYACDSSYRYYEMGITNKPDLALYKEKFGAIRMPMRSYTKTFSPFKTMTNNVYGNIRKCGKKMVGAFRN
jgi:hypothetical protein